MNKYIVTHILNNKDFEKITKFLQIKLLIKFYLII